MTRRRGERILRVPVSPRRRVRFPSHVTALRQVSDLLVSGQRVWTERLIVALHRMCRDYRRSAWPDSFRFWRLTSLQFQARPIEPAVADSTAPVKSAGERSRHPWSTSALASVL